MVWGSDLGLAVATRIIQFIIAPVVMVSACGLILNGILARYAQVNDRLRLMVHERWELLRSVGQAAAGSVNVPDPLIAERLHEIDVQAPQLLGRHHQLRDAVLLVYVALFLFIACMVTIGVAATTGPEWLAAVALAIFFLGNGALLLGVLRTALEVYRSHRVLDFEVKRVLNLGEKDHP
jgi:hypothetical protein